MNEYDEKNLRPLLFLSRKLKKLYEKECAEAGSAFGLTQSEIDVLLFLANNKGFDTAMDIVRYRSVSKALVSNAVDSLTARGYLKTHINPADRRYTHLVITDKAAGAVRALQRAQEAFAGLLKDETTPEERAVIAAVMGRLYRKFEND